MAEYKSQHYVPQVYLRNFSKDGKTIGCCYVNPENKKFRLLFEAHIKKEACKDYFYSKDVRLEQEFSKLEGEANIIIQKILSTEKSAIELGEVEFLKQYVLFQHFRTPFHADEYEDMMLELYHRVAPEDKSEIRLKNKQIFILQTFTPLIPEIAEPFKLIILENKTDIPFITSPEPSIFFNSYLLNRKINTFGFQAHGGIFYMPLSARKAILLYDPIAYKIKNKGYCSLSDVSCLNRLLMHIVEVSKTYKFYFDNGITDVRNMISLMLQYITADIKFSFMRERFYLFGIPKRGDIDRGAKLLQYTKPVKVEDFKEYMQTNIK